MAKIGFVCLGVSSWIFAAEEVPLDVLLSSSIMHVDASDYLRPFNIDVWKRAYVNETEDSTPFYPQRFKHWEDYVLQLYLNVSQNEIDDSLCKNVYLMLSAQDPPNIHVHVS